MTGELLNSAVRHLTIFDGVLVVLVLVLLLYRRHHAFVVCWSITTIMMLVFTFALCRLGSALYVDPRPHTLVHLSFLAPLKPLLPHVANNSFPSGHAVLTGVIVASVFLISTRWAIPFVMLGVLVEWARLGLGWHQAIDTLGGWLFVLIATIVAACIGPVVTAVLLPSISPKWSAEHLRLNLSAVSDPHS